MRRLISIAFRTALFSLPLVLTCNTTLAAGFALLEQSSSRLGNAFAGTAAAAEDATTLYFNPAGLIHVKGGQVAMSLSDVLIKSEFTDTGSQPALGQTLGNDGGNAGGPNLVPSAYGALNFDEHFAFGVGVNAPFGLKLEYDSDWIGRFQARRSEIKTLNINPAFAFRLNKTLTLAAGVDYQRLQAELTSGVNYSAVVAQALQQRLLAGQITLAQFSALVAANGGLQGHTVVSGEDWAWGFNVGMLIDVSDDARLGLAYRSPIKYQVRGDATFGAPTAIEPNGAAVIAAVSGTGGPLASGPVSVDLKVPGSATFSYWQKVAPRVELLADVAWTQWSSIDELRVLRTGGTTLSVTPENWRDTWRAAIGASLAVNSDWKLRTGVAYDQTPVPDSTRTPRLPDSNRYWLALGASWSPSESMTVDFAYAHLFSKNVPVNQNTGSTSAYGLILGEQSNTIDIVTAQVSYKF